MTTTARKTVWAFIPVIYVLSSVLQFPVARGTLTIHDANYTMTADGTPVVSLNNGSQQTFTCDVGGAAAGWTITDLSGITATQVTGLVAANNNPRITTTDTTGATPSSTIIISGFNQKDNQGEIHCINLEDNSVQGKAFISIDELTPDGIVQVSCGESQKFICTGYKKAFLWNITGLSGIDTTEPFSARIAALDYSRISSGDIGDFNEFGDSDITISGFSAADNGGTVQCINKEDNSVQGTATILIKNTLVPIDQAAVNVPVLEGKRVIFTCKLKDAGGNISWSLTSVEGVHTDINPNRTNVAGSSGSFLSPDTTQLVITGVQNSLNGTRVECSPANVNKAFASICAENVHISVHNFTTVSPALIRKITLTSRLAVVIVWSVPGFVADYIDGSVISVVMVTPSGPKPIRCTPVGKRVIAFAVDFPEKGASYQVTVYMTMNGSRSRPLNVELNI